MTAQGVASRPGFKKIAIDMPEELFDKILTRAIKAGVPFNTIAVTLLSCGVLDYEESESHEPTPQESINQTGETQ